MYFSCNIIIIVLYCNFFFTYFLTAYPFNYCVHNYNISIQSYSIYNSILVFLLLFMSDDARNTVQILEKLSRVKPHIEYTGSL
jgi:hypothetical protein